MARPSSTTPFGVVTLPGLSGPVKITEPAPAPSEADLNASWRGLMVAMGQAVPFHLNRAVAVVNRGHTWAR